MANAQGIDVSSFQGTFDWAAERSSISFGFAKATEGSTITDSEFARNWQQMKAIGIVRGAYHFAHPKNGAATEARAFVAVVRAQGLEPGDMLALDLETSDGLAPAQVATFARNWCADVKAATGRTPIIYTFIDFALEGNCAGLGGHPLWIADPSSPPGRPTVPHPWTTWAFHQYATTILDRDEFNGDTAALKKFAQPAPAAKKEQEVQTGTLINGANAVTPISIPFGSAKEIGFAADNGLQKLPSARLRVAVFNGGWDVHNPIEVDSSKGQAVVKFSKPGSTSVVSVQRLDDGEVNVSYQVS